MCSLGGLFYLGFMLALLLWFKLLLYLFCLFMWVFSLFATAICFGLYIVFVDFWCLWCLLYCLVCFVLTLFVVILGFVYLVDCGFYC